MMSPVEYQSHNAVYNSFDVNRLFDLLSENLIVKKI